MNTVGHLVIFITIQYAIAQDFALGKCADFSVIKNFDLEKVSKKSFKTFNISSKTISNFQYMGIWYEYAKYFSLSQLLKLSGCVSSEYQNTSTYSQEKIKIITRGVDPL